tara:strand:+ start:129 stop:1511 length:1383 start_codon:yes stop_codon:yes gene_type:complete
VTDNDGKDIRFKTNEEVSYARIYEDRYHPDKLAENIKGRTNHNFFSKEDIEKNQVYTLKPWIGPWNAYRVIKCSRFQKPNSFISNLSNEYLRYPFNLFFELMHSTKFENKVFILLLKLVFYGLIIYFILIKLFNVNIFKPIKILWISFLIAIGLLVLYGIIYLISYFMDKNLVPQTYIISVLKDVYYSASNTGFGLIKVMFFSSLIIMGSIYSIYGTFLMNILTLFFNVDSTTARGESKWTIRFLMITLMVICTSLLILYKRVDKYNDNPYQNDKEENITDEDMELYPKYWEIQMAAIDNENETKGGEITRNELDKLKFTALFGPIANYESNKDIIMDEATCSSDSQGEVTFYGMGPFFWLLLVTVLFIGQVIYSKMMVSSKLTEKESIINRASSWASSKLDGDEKSIWLKIINLISKIFIKSSPFIIVILTIMVWYHEYVGDMSLSGAGITDFVKRLIS